MGPMGPLTRAESGGEITRADFAAAADILALLQWKGFPLC